MVHRNIATLSGALMVCFLLLTFYEPQFFGLHFYQALIYLIIILMLFYFEDRWAYSFGILTPATWLVLTYMTGLLGGALRQVGRLMHAQTASNAVSVIAAIIAVLSLAMIATCAYYWKREFAGLGKGWSTFLPGLAIVAAYYGLLVYWFWNIFPKETAVGL